MNDSNTTIKELRKFIDTFVEERDWDQFHSPKNCSMDIAVEAAELMEKFMWCGSKESRKEAEENIQEIKSELADIVIGILCFARSTKIDIAEAVINKLEEIKKKYPVEKAKGKSTKYNKL